MFHMSYCNTPQGCYHCENRWQTNHVANLVPESPLPCLQTAMSPIIYRLSVSTLTWPLAACSEKFLWLQVTSLQSVSCPTCLSVTFVLAYVAADLHYPASEYIWLQWFYSLISCIWSTLYTKYFCVRIVCVCKFLSWNVINCCTHDKYVTSAHKKWHFANKTLLQSVFSIACWIHKKSKSVDAPNKMWGKLQFGGAWFLIWNLLHLFLCRTNGELNVSTNGM